MTFNKKGLLVPTAVVFLGFLGVSAAKADPQCYTVASLKGNYALVTRYGNDGDHVAQALSVRHFDGNGNLRGTFIVNQPVVGSPTGERKINNGTAVGTYTVNCDGTGVFNRILSTANGTVVQSEDFLITEAVINNGQFLATAIVDMSRTPSPIVPGGLFVTRTYTRRPDPSE
jgi:hypothetical protein